MYTAIQAIGVRNGINKRWEVIDLSTISVKALLANFRKVQVKLMPEQDTVAEYLNLRDIAPRYATFSGTIAQMLVDNGDTSLPTAQVGIQLNPAKAHFRDAFKAGYTVTPVNAVNVIDAAADQNSLPNIRLTRVDSAVDYSYMFNHCLVSVNGFYHRTDTDGVHGLMVSGGMNTLNKSGQNQVGILSFASMCDIKIVPMTDSMIDTTVITKPVVTLSEDMSNKSLLLILGGYMVTVDGAALKQVGASSYKIDFTQLNLVERFYESSLYTDMNDLQVNPASGSPNEISIGDLTTDEVIRNWLKLSQSFLVVLDTPEVYFHKQYIARSGLPNLYFSYIQPNDLLSLELGRHPSYWSSFNDGQWRISLYDNVIGNELYYTRPIPTWMNTSGSDISGAPNHLSQAYFLEIGRDY